ncbi:MAG: hypothetical protein L3J39_13185 [Verrucomicrobiales bacterium]|nr:hypothetical protein [Verrucomicrobiales bacterium]
MKAKRISRIRTAWIFVGIATTVLIGYVLSYGFFKTQSGWRSPDPWVGSNSRPVILMWWGASGEIIRPVRYSMNPKLARALDDFYLPVKYIDQRLSGSQISFTVKPFLRTAKVTTEVVVGGEESINEEEFTIDLSLEPSIVSFEGKINIKSRTSESR